MANIPTRLPAPLSQRLSGTSSALLQRNGKEVDVAIGGIPFLLATSKELPQSIETIPQRKEQIDTEAEPGEQSLVSNWWRRGQESFHDGAGNLYQESRSENGPLAGFYDSRGIDVFTRGEMKLLRKMERVGSLTKHSRLRSFAAGGTRTNLVLNPSLEVDTWGISYYSGTDPAPTLARSTVRSWSGGASLHVTMTGPGSPQIRFNTEGLVAGKAYTFSARVYIPSGNPDFRCVRDGGYMLATEVQSNGVRDAWVQVSVSFVADDNSPVGIIPVAPLSGPAEYWVDGAFLEEGIGVKPYFDGESAGASWTGTAHRSSSTQTIAEIAAGVSAIYAGTLKYGKTADSMTTLHAPSGKTLTDGFVAGTNFYSVATDGTLYEGLISSPGTATTWACGAGPTRLGFGKHRLWMIGGRKIWQPDLSLAGGSNQAPIFTHPSQGWVYTCMAEGPQAMYFGGHDGRTSSIQAITLNADGGLPALSGAQVTAILPDGELVQEIAVLTGQFIGIGTNRGFRVGVIDGVNIVYGPLLVEPEGVLRCTSLGTQDHFFLVGFQTDAQPAELWRVDASRELADGIFPYARDIECDSTGSITSMAQVAEKVLVVTDDQGRVWQQSPTELVEIGSLTTGRIRFRTNERKLFKYIELDTDPLDGTIVVDGYNEANTRYDVATISETGEAGTAPLPLRSDLGPQRHVAFRFTLVRDQDDATKGPVLRSYMVRALPSIKPQRMITLPLLCYDREQGHSGMRYGYEGYAEDRLTALEAIEDVGDSIVYQNFSLRGNNSGEVVVIDNMRFVQNAPGYPKQDASGRGGILILQLRTVTA